MGQIYIPGTAAAGDVLTGKTFSAGTNYQAAGTMADRGAPTWTPGTSNQSLSAGYYSGGTISGDADLIAANILSGKSIFGVAGSVIAGKRSASGTKTAGTGTLVSVSGLGFTPAIVIIEYVTSGDVTYRRFYWRDSAHMLANDMYTYGSPSGNTVYSGQSASHWDVYNGGFNVNAIAATAGSTAVNWLAIE